MLLTLLMSNAIDFPVGKSIKNNSTVLAALVIRLPPEYATASTLAEDLSQPKTRRSHPVEGGQNNTIRLADSYHQGDSSKKKTTSLSGYS